MHVYASTRARLFGNYMCRMHWSHQYVKEILEMENSLRNAERQGERTKRREFMNIHEYSNRFNKKTCVNDNRVRGNALEN